MAPHRRRADRPVAERLFTEGWRFDFFQAVRLLERHVRRVSVGERIDAEEEPAHCSVGERSEPEKEAVRFRSRVSFDFPASDVDRIEPPPRKGEPAVMTVNFMGLAGALGPLPHPFTELLLERRWQKDEAFGDFLDLFNHRLISLLYRARRQVRPYFAFERPGEGPFAEPLFAFLGLGLPQLRERGGFPDRALLPFAGLLVNRPRAASGLVALLGAYFAVPVAVRQLVGRWLEIEPDQRTALGLRNHALGRDASLGSRVWDQQGKIEVRLGPLTLSQFLDFLPTGRAFRALVGLVRYYVDEGIDFDVRLTLQSNQVPPCRLGWGPRLGWSAWLKTGDFTADDSQVVLRGREWQGER
jgi:type VI secretion system protein ImpH